MSKILISPIGVGPLKENGSSREYKEAEYKFIDSEKKYKTSFIASALVEHISIDKLYFIGTSKSMWEEVYRYFINKSNVDFDEDYYFELGEKIDKSGYNSPHVTEEDLSKINEIIDIYLKRDGTCLSRGSKCLLLDYGIDHNELWNNFDIFMGIMNEFNDGDEIYLDITHSFRSIPLFMYLMMDFIKILARKEIKLAGVYYGMLDIKKELDYAPVVDLAPLFKISEWIRGVYNFKNYGDAQLISNLTNNKKISQKLENITQIININYLKELKKELNSLDKIINGGKLSDLKITKYLLPEMKVFVERFSNIKNDSKFQLEIAKWFFEHNRYSNGYICLLEAILTGLCEIYNLESQKKYNRDIMRNFIFNNKFKQQFDIIRKISYDFDNINKIRIRIAHASYIERTGSYKNDINMCHKYYNRIDKYLNDKELNELPSKVDLYKIKKHIN